LAKIGSYEQGCSCRIYSGGNRDPSEQLGSSKQAARFRDEVCGNRDRDPKQGAFSQSNGGIKEFANVGRFRN
jgi:hypothetical protein